jgi:hypothetical protein
MRTAIAASLLILVNGSFANAASAVAIAVNESGYVFGMAEDPIASAAEEKALVICRTKATNPATASRCKIVASVPKGCVSVAAGPTWAAWGSGSQESAEKTALNACNGRSKSCSVVASECTKDMSATSAGQTQVVEGRGLQLTEMNMRGDRGFVGDKRMYNKVWLEFAPADHTVKKIDMSGPFALEGAAYELGVYSVCITGHGVLVYDSAGPRHIEYSCVGPDQICVAGSCRKNIRGPTAVTSETSFVRDGNVFHLKGKATAVWAAYNSERSNSITELIDFDIQKDGTCRLINYRKEARSEERYLKEERFDRKLDVPETIVTQSEAGASCDVFKAP